MAVSKTKRSFGKWLADQGCLLTIDQLFFVVRDFMKLAPPKLDAKQPIICSFPKGNTKREEGLTMSRCFLGEIGHPDKSKAFLCPKSGVQRQTLRGASCVLAPLRPWPLPHVTRPAACASKAAMRIAVSAAQGKMYEALSTLVISWCS